jgi:hypothetical protein
VRFSGPAAAIVALGFYSALVAAGLTLGVGVAVLRLVVRRMEWT